MLLEQRAPSDSEGLFWRAGDGRLLRVAPGVDLRRRLPLLDAVPEVKQIEIDTPNLHYLPAKLLDAVGEKFEDDVFIPTSEPSARSTASWRAAPVGGPLRLLRRRGPSCC